MKLTKDQIKQKYHLDESHATWQPQIDNWFSVEAIRLVKGSLPEEGDDIIGLLMKFLDDGDLQRKLLRERGVEFGSIYLSAKRALYRYAILV